MNARRRTSKKRSGAKRPERPLVLFVDECLGRHLVPDALIAAGAAVEPYHTQFQPGTPDAEWLPAVGRKGWVVLTKDRHVRRRPIEVQAILSSGVKAFVLTCGDLQGLEQAALLVKVLPKIRRLCRRPGPFIATITRSGIVQIDRTR
jgi:predicted nuclease of predicted toxin-antitoxin system